MSQEENKKKPDNIWWEFYFVRYFVGTAIGAIIVLFLAMSESPVFTSQGAVATILKSLKPEKFESGYIVVLATIGLAFCYIASSPILVLHATRGSLLKIQVRSNWWLFVIFVSLVLVAASTQIYWLYSALQPKGNIWMSHDFYAGSMVLLTVSGIFIGQLFLLRFSLLGKENNAFKYYDELMKKRAKADTIGDQYIESYRHLREHGNAFFIVFLELLLGAALFYSPFPWVVLPVLWIFPAAGVWLFGTLLENRNFPATPSS
jgi:hypothetical protein